MDFISIKKSLPGKVFVRSFLRIVALAMIRDAMGQTLETTTSYMSSVRNERVQSSIPSSSPTAASSAPRILPIYQNTACPGRSVLSWPHVARHLHYL